MNTTEKFHVGETEKQDEPLVQRETPVPHATNLSKETAGTTVEEAFFKFCVKYLESPEREGKLPANFTELSIDEFHELATLPKRFVELSQRIESDSLMEGDKEAILLIERVVELQKREEAGERLTNKEMETLRVVDAAKALFHRRHNTVEVHSKDEVHNPLGEVGNVTLLIVADLHHAPTSVETGIREQAFSRYAPLRAASKIADKVAEGTAFSEMSRDLIEDDKSAPTNVYKRYIFREAALGQFRNWLQEVIDKDQYSLDKGTEPILVDLGDRVHDAGSNLIDQLGETTNALEMITQTQGNGRTVRSIEIYGNHDQDARIPESVEMLTELYGHKIFTQEVAGGVLIAGIDTNVLNPAWVEQFIANTGESGDSLIKQRRELQQMVFDKIANHKGPIVLLGHNPSRMIRALAVDQQILQNSSVQRIIAGHTHKEDHVTLPFTNKDGEPIVMDVVESFVRVSDGKPKPPKVYTLDIRNGHIETMNIVQEPQNRFQKEAEAMM